MLESKYRLDAAFSLQSEAYRRRRKVGETLTLYTITLTDAMKAKWFFTLWFLNLRNRESLRHSRLRKRRFRKDFQERSNT